MTAQMGALQRRFYDILNERHPTMTRGVQEARAIAPALVDQKFEQTLEWITRGFGDEILTTVADGYAWFTMDVNRVQIAYEKEGRYRASSFAEVDRLIYQQPDYMRHYYWGVFAILFCWPHYVELIEFYLDRFVRKLPEGRLVEIAPGHGAWGLLAVASNNSIALEGWDVSPTSLELAPRMAEGAGLAARTVYRVADATKMAQAESRFDAAVCCFMLEHLEDPGGFLASFAPSLKRGATAFVTLALTAAQPDHIYEFKQASEAIEMAERAGFDLLDCRMAQPSRLLPKASYVPRVQAMILRKK